MGSQTCRLVGKSQPVLIMINPMIFTRSRPCVCLSVCLSVCMVAGSCITYLPRAVLGAANDHDVLGVHDGREPVCDHLCDDMQHD
jgi:hypothetical protein